MQHHKGHTVYLEREKNWVSQVKEAGVWIWLEHNTVWLALLNN